MTGVSVYLLSENDEQSPENGDDVDEEVDAMPNEIVISTTALFYDQLGVVQHATAHDCQAEVQFHLE